MVVRKRLSRGESWAGWLGGFEVGEHRYIDTTLKTHAKDRSEAMGARGAKRPKSIQGKEYSISVGTIVWSAKVGPVQYIMRVERTK